MASAAMVAIVASAPPLAGQVRAPESLEISRISLESPHSVVGVVYDVESGDPLPEAVVSIVGSELATLTDSLGRFGIELDGPGSIELRIVLIGYGTSGVSVELDSLQSAALAVGVKSQPVEMCATVVCANPYGCDRAVVYVRDVTTGLAPSGRVTLRVLGADTVLAVSAVGSGEGGAVELGLPIRPHSPPRVAEVVADGYRPWRSPELRGPCGHVGPNEFYVWLVPG